MEEHSNNHKKKKRIIKNYDLSSHFYDKRYKAIQEEKYEILVQNYRANGKRILDMGCGTGLFFEYFKKYILDKRTKKIDYIGLDISWNMLLQFKSKLFIPHVPNLILSDIEFLPFRNNVFHSIFALTSFQNLPGIQKGIIESLRVSKNNADFNFSILKKKIELKSLLYILKSKINHLKTLESDKLEDIIITGKISKGETF